MGFIISSFILSKPTIPKIALSFTIYFLLSFILYADVVYERYCDALLDFQLLSQTNQVGAVFGSVLSLIYYSYLWFWFDIPLMLILLVYYTRSNKTQSAGVAAIGAYPQKLEFLLCS
ncbi:hypothetical protein BSG1_20265 [Bacillus sp. SG-1]|nr:hypothetical protein BSG1_20265 [Bacillus sp. SG-1]